MGVFPDFAFEVWYLKTKSWPWRVCSYMICFCLKRECGSGVWGRNQIRKAHFCIKMVLNSFEVSSNQGLQIKYWIPWIIKRKLINVKGRDAPRPRKHSECRVGAFQRPQGPHSPSLIPSQQDSLLYLTTGHMQHHSHPGFHVLCSKSQPDWNWNLSSPTQHSWGTGVNICIGW